MIPAHGVAWAAGSDTEALALIAEERAARADTIRDFVLTGTAKPPLARELKKRLGYIVNHGEPIAALVEPTEAYAEEYVGMIERSLEILTALLREQKARA